MSLFLQNHLIFIGRCNLLDIMESMFVLAIIPGCTLIAASNVVSNISTQVSMCIANIGQQQSFSQFGYRCSMSTMTVKAYLDFV